MSVSKKVVLLGHYGVGKSSLLRRFVENIFSEDYKVTIGVHIMKKTVSLKGKEDINLVIWDVEGVDDFTKYRSSYLIGTAAFIYVFDLTREATFKNLSPNLQTIEEQYPNIPVHIIGNKVDLIDDDLIETILEDSNITYDYLTSAKTGENVETLFQDVATQLM